MGGIGVCGRQDRQREAEEDDGNAEVGKNGGQDCARCHEQENKSFRAAMNALNQPAHQANAVLRLHNHNRQAENDNGEENGAIREARRGIR